MIINKFIALELIFKGRMNETNPQAKKLPMPNLNNKQKQTEETFMKIHVNASQNLLSPFTWTHIKLPKINNHRMPMIDEGGKKSTISKGRSGGKIKKKNTLKLEIINKTIDLSDFHKVQRNSGDFKKMEKVREKNTSQNRRYEEINSMNFRKSKNQPQQMNKGLDLDKDMKMFKKELITKHLQKEPKELKELKDKERDNDKQVIAKHLQKRMKEPKQSKEKEPKQAIIKHLQKEPSELIVDTSLTHPFSKTDRENSIRRSQLSSPRYSQISNIYFTPQSFSFNKMEKYMYRALLNSSWHEIAAKNRQQIPQLLWSDNYVPNKHLVFGQLHNHIKNAHVLTTKIGLHEIESAHGSSHYPQSFLLPDEYGSFAQEYEHNIVKICLKSIIQASRSRLPNRAKFQKCLGTILPRLTKSTLQDNDRMAIRLCLYLEKYRKSHNYRYFETLETYVPVETNLQQSLVTCLINACYSYWETLQLNQESNFFRAEFIDLDILEVLWNYHCMLIKYDSNYSELEIRNSWIVKPIASSKGAGISLLKNSMDFLAINEAKCEFANKKKFGNKLVQKYIENPLILAEPAEYAGRKFDIRQWVLVACGKESSSPLIYLYSEAYCRFSELKYKFDSRRSNENKIHLTNYSIFKSNPQSPKAPPSVLMLSQLFKIPQYQSLQSTYEKAMKKIVIESIMNVSELEFSPNTFELFGYDVLIDEQKKLWLLEINLNPACQSSRYEPLEKEIQKMAMGLIKIVRQASGRVHIHKKQRELIGWDLIYGQEKANICESESIDFQNADCDPEIKPFYSVTLNADESLVEEVRRRNIMMKSIMKIVSIVNLREVWSMLKVGQGLIEREKESTAMNQLQ